MNHQLERELADILTCTVSSVDDVYDRVLDLLQKRARVGLMGFFRGAEIDGDVHYDGVCSKGDADAVRFVRQLDGGPILDGPSLDVKLPPRDEINAFVAQDADTPAFQGTLVEKKFLSPLDIHSAVRILIYRGDRFVGYLGCFRRGDQPRCDLQLRRDLEPMRDSICAALTAADQLHRDRLPDGEGFATFNPAGGLQYASPEAASFLGDDEREQLAHIIRELDGGDITKCIQVIRGVEVRITRMEGGGVFRYLVQFVAPAMPTLDPTARLTPAQREIADHVCTGASNAEIADATQRAVGTVKVHLRNIYSRLDISGRTELMTMLLKGAPRCQTRHQAN